MDFLPDTDQQALVDSTHDFVESRFPLLTNHFQIDDVRWKEIAELGWLGLGAEEDAGGAGASLLDEAFVFREIGRGLVPGPILATLAAARLASWTGDTTLAGELIGGQARVARAIADSGGNGRLLLLEAPGAQLTLLVSADRAELFATPDELELTPGLEDGSLLGRADRDALGVPVLTSDDHGTVARLRRVLAILTSAELAGIAGATRDLATAYAKDRVQFGKPIGAFQAIKHRCADMATNALAADNVMFFAALTESERPTGADYETLAAAALCRRAAFANTRANVQIHGAMGFTVEDSAHRFVKRTHILCTTEGFDRAAARLGALRRDDMNGEQ